jgi:hypothetical protein
MAEDFIGGAAIVPYDFLVLIRNLRYGHRQAAGIRPQENVNLVLSQKLEYVLPGKADLTAIVMPNQPDRPFLAVPDANAALGVDIRLPAANTLDRLLTLGAEPAGQGNGQPDRNFCLVAHTRSPALDLPLAQVGIALLSPEEAHRVFILDILGTIYSVDHLAFGANSVTGTNVLDNLLKLASHRVPITPEFDLNLVVRHRTSSRLWPDPQCPQLLAVQSIRYAASLALKEACALILSDVWITDSDPVETFCPRSPRAQL